MQQIVDIKRTYTVNLTDIIHIKLYIVFLKLYVLLKLQIIWPFYIALQSVSESLPLSRNVDYIAINM